MNHINNYSYFLMDQTLDYISESSGTWDEKNKRMVWDLTKSIKQSEDKLSWYDRLLSKIKNFSPKLKKLIIISVVPILLMAGISINNLIDNSKSDEEVITLLTQIKAEPIEVEEVIKDPEFKKISKKPFSEFLTAIAQRESSGNWKAENGHYMGLYQFGKTALKDIARTTKDMKYKKIHKEITIEKFKKDPSIFPVELQQEVMLMGMRNNRHYLRNFYSYIGKTINGIEITEAALLGGAHLVGQGGVKKFLKSDGKKDPVDGNGVHVSEYLRLFNNYEIEI